MTTARLLLGAVALVAAACSAGGGAAGSGSASASASSAPAAAPADLRPIAEAEQRRAASMIGDPDLSSRDPAVRRAAARALARIGGAASARGLMRALSDEDPEVVAWAAYGLGGGEAIGGGWKCRGDREAVVAALAARALSLRDTDVPVAFGPIARAVGRCASSRSEATLAAWLDGPPERAREAALGLADLATQLKGPRDQARLREETHVALLARAEGGVAAPPLPEALVPISRVENVPPSVTGRLGEVARARLAEPGPYRLFAVRALGRAREAGVAPLERALGEGASKLTMPERVEAARAAARLGTDGQVLLAKILTKMAETPSELAKDADSAAISGAVLASLKDPRGAEAALDKIAKLAAPDGANDRQRRLVSGLRCAAAKVVVKRAADALLVGCDLDKGWIGKRAFAEVLGRSKIEGPAVKMYTDLLADPDVRVREAALELLAAHPEIEGPAAILEAALKAKEPGVASIAAEQIAKNPNLASDRKAKKKPAPSPKDEKPKKGEPPKDKKPDEKPADKKDDKKPDEKKPPDKKDDKRPDQEKPVEVVVSPDAGVVAALIGLLERAEKDKDLEMLAAAIDAMAAVGAKDFVAKIEPHCKSSYPAAREHAASALTLLNGKKTTCEPPERAAEIAPETGEAAKASSLVFETDVGELTIDLDPELAPVTTLRIADIARSGYYDGNVIHRVDPSFVVQFGAPFPDGYSGLPGKLPLRCETSPKPFEELSVGVALSGRDTGSSQLFVMRARHPHLDGLYPIVGKASGPWQAIAEGDVIKKVRVVEK
ncbi:MAG: peptidylprolyl isomerase [Polyangiaceae bacterium]|nr:peptidylprolyl isomerase [Polyangiaceae bacterium]